MLIKIRKLKIGLIFSLQASDFQKKIPEFLTLKVLHWATSELYVDQALINLSNSRNINTRDGQIYHRLDICDRFTIESTTDFLPVIGEKSVVNLW